MRFPFRLSLSALFAGSLVIAAGPETLPREQEAVVRALEKEIATVRGLEFKQPVAFQRPRRPNDDVKTSPIRYDFAARKLLLGNEPGNLDRGELVRGLVHALLDQHFDLGKLRQRVVGSDQDLALTALVEGDATWTRIMWEEKRDPKAAAVLEVPLEKAADLRQAFVSLQGARYVQALHQRGGWKQVNAAYRFPPRTTAAILQPDGVATIDLGPGKTRGAYSWIEQFRQQPRTAAEAVPALAGWQGDRFQEHGTQQAGMVAFATAADARRFLETLVRWQSAAMPDLRSVQSESGVRVWRNAAGAFVGMWARGDRVFFVEAPDESSYRARSENVAAPPEVAVYAAGEGPSLSFGALIDRLLAADLICIGETHDSDLHHLVQHQIVKGLFARDERLGVGMEMFQRPYQHVLDRYGRAEIGEEQLLKDTEYRQRWGYAWSLYRPVVEYCRRNGMPLAALNAPKELTTRISRVGVAGLTEAEKLELGPIDWQVIKHRAHWYDRLAEMHGQKDAPAEQKERSYQVMTTWDGFMANSAARFQKERQLRRLVVLAGSGHIERGFGIPERASQQTGGKVLTVGIQTGGTPESFRREPLTDFLVIVK